MEKFYSVFNHLHVNKSKIKIDFDDWTLQNSVLIDGNTRQAYHMILHGLFKYQRNGHPNTIAVRVQFSSQGGIASADYELVPMGLENMVRVIQQQFLGKKC